MPVANTNRLERGVMSLFNNLIVMCRIEDKGTYTLLGFSDLACTFFGKDSLDGKKVFSSRNKSLLDRGKGG